MTARNPTSYNDWISERSLTEGSQILQATPEKVFDDQEYVLLSAVQIVSDAFAPVEPVTGTETTLTEIKRYYVRGKDHCTASTTSNESHNAQAPIFVANGEDITLEISSVVAGDTQSATYTNSSGSDVETILNIGNFNMRSNTEETLILKIRTSNAAYTPEVFGLVVYSD